jgi:hypothetical protein
MAKVVITLEDTIDEATQKPGASVTLDFPEGGTPEELLATMEVSQLPPSHKLAAFVMQALQEETQRAEELDATEDALATAADDADDFADVELGPPSCSTDGPCESCQ